MNGEPFGLYLHIPFCARKCGYCDFYSVTSDELLMDRYLAALQTDLAHRAAALGGRRACTLYLGGGTPILFGAKRLCALLDACVRHFGLRDAEITLEANPNHTDEDTLRALQSAGYNRISFGVQSAVDQELRALTRSHTARQAQDAIEAAYRAGFENVSADLMLGIPFQTRDSLAYSVRFLSQLTVSHVSAYLLKIEPGTPFYAQRQALALPDEDLTAQLYLDAADALARAGYRQYELSNYARRGKACRHNLLYWNQREYLGLGPAAHSFLNGARLAYPNDLSAYLAGCEPQRIDDGGDLDEYIMLRLRLAQGLVFEQARRRFANFDACKLLQKARPLCEQGLCVATDRGVRLTQRGFLFSNRCIVQLL